MKKLILLLLVSHVSLAMEMLDDVQEKIVNCPGVTATAVHDCTEYTIGCECFADDMENYLSYNYNGTFTIQYTCL